MAISPLFAISILRNGGVVDVDDVEDDDGEEKDRVCCNEKQLGLMKLSDCKDVANFDLMGELLAEDVGVVLLTLLKHLQPVQLIDLGDVE